MDQQTLLDVHSRIRRVHPTGEPARPSLGSTFMSALARWCQQHRLLVVAAWIILLVGLGALSKSAYKDSFSLPDTDSTRAQNLLTAAFPAQAGESDTVVW